jgi:hypothetical protein
MTSHHFEEFDEIRQFGGFDILFHKIIEENGKKF